MLDEYENDVFSSAFPVFLWLMYVRIVVILSLATWFVLRTSAFSRGEDTQKLVQSSYFYFLPFFLHTFGEVSDDHFPCLHSNQKYIKDVLREKSLLHNTYLYLMRTWLWALKYANAFSSDIQYFLSFISFICSSSLVSFYTECDKEFVNAYSEHCGS